MKLHDILKGSDYSLELFTPASIEALENRINEKVDKKGKDKLHNEIKKITLENFNETLYKDL